MTPDFQALLARLAQQPGRRRDVPLLALDAPWRSEAFAEDLDEPAPQRRSRPPGGALALSVAFALAAVTVALGWSTLELPPVERSAAVAQR
jgi:hypothetical protein